MEPTMHDVKEMVSALMAVVSGIERAKRQGPAAALSALYVIAAREPVRPSDLSLEMGLHQSSITRQIQTLESAGQVEVAADPDDGRSCFVRLTDKGREEMGRLTEIGLRRFALFVEGWDAEDVRTLARLLNKLEVSKAEAHKRETPPESWRERKKRR